MNELAGDMFNLDEWSESTKPTEAKEVDTSAAQWQQAKAGAVRKQIKQIQNKNTILSKFLTKVLGKFGGRSKVINGIFHILEDDDENGLEFIYIIFYPYIDAPELKELIRTTLKIEIVLTKSIIDTPGKYIDYLSTNQESLKVLNWQIVWEPSIDAILLWMVDLLESTRTWWKDFWDALKEKNSDITYENFVDTLKEDMKKNLI